MTSRVRRGKGGQWWVRCFGSLQTCPSPFATKREALAWAARNESVAKEHSGITDADEAAALAALAPKPRAVRPVRMAKLSAVLKSLGGEPPGGWDAADLVA